MQDRSALAGTCSSPGPDSSGASIPLVDVVITAWNRADTIERAVRSALAEPDVRTVIVIDDGSTDNTAVLAKQCDPGGHRLVIEHLPSNVGPSAARNIGIERSTAPWLAILDGDDYFLPGRIQTLLARATAWDFVADDLLQVREDQIGERTPTPILFGDDFEPTPLDLEHFVLGNVKQHGVLRRELGFLKPLIRRSFLDNHRLRYDKSLRLGEDYALYARALALRARFLVIPAAGYVSVVRANSLSARHTRQDLERLRDSDRKLIANADLTTNERCALRRHYSSVDCRVQWLVLIKSVKSRRYGRFLATFCHSPTISLFLMARLMEEIYRRTRPT